MMNPAGVKKGRSSPSGKMSNVADMYPLSPMQQGMLFHALNEPGTGVYFSQVSYVIDPLDPAAFRFAWTQMVRRHPVLRTGFLWENLREPVQVVKKNVELPWREDDWSHLDDAEQQDRWEKLLREERKKGFDLRQAPLLRFSVIRKRKSTHYFAMNWHHILMDATCEAIIIQEVFKLYEA